MMLIEVKAVKRGWPRIFILPIILVTSLLPAISDGARRVSLRSGMAPGRAVSRIFQKISGRKTGPGSGWRQTAAIPLRFNTHHPQGMVRVGREFYLSSVEVTRETRRYREPVGGADRDEGAGIGHLFKFNDQGQLLEDLRIGEGSIYHPGGIDYDGRFIWIPVAEYRPESRSIVYQVDLMNRDGMVSRDGMANRDGMVARESFRFNDHLGGIVHQVETRTLHAVSWGARRFYHWPLALPNTRELGLATYHPRRADRPGRQLNRSFYIDYQDCHYLGAGEMLCGGLREYRNGTEKLSLGGLELVDLATGLARQQVPVELWTSAGLPMTRNPFWVEPLDQEAGLRAFFVPEDRQSTLYVYEIEAPRP